jgi:hypothetical protein
MVDRSASLLEPDLSGLMARGEVPSQRNFAISPGNSQPPQSLISPIVMSVAPSRDDAIGIANPDFAASLGASEPTAVDGDDVNCSPRGRRNAGDLR